jgi:hypothetical protein
MAKVRDRYHLTQPQLRAFAATQFKLQEMRGTSDRAFVPLDSSVPFPRAYLGESGPLPEATPMPDAGKTRALLEAQARGLTTAP